MQTIVLIGENIAHSRSPRLHNHLFRAYDLSYRYELMPLASCELADAIERMKGGDRYRGANVTSPHKEIVLPLMDELTEEAEAIGAVNTIVFESGRAIGHNTDAAGFRAPLEGDPIFFGPFTAAIIGTGGAARAAAYELARERMLVEMTIYSRDRERARRFARDLGIGRVRGSALDEFFAHDLVVHATPIGLAGAPGRLLDTAKLRGVGLLYEMIYSPGETELAGAARLAGARVISGRAMFVGQALRAFELWTGVTAAERDVPSDLFEE